MLTKYSKIMLFIVYSYCIYQSYLFIWATLTLVTQDFTVSAHRVDSFFNYLFSPFIMVWVIWDGFFNGPLPLYGFLSYILIIVLYGLLFIPWCKRQTAGRAWLLALTGLLAGPGGGLWFRTIGDGGNPYAPIVFNILNCIYFFLYAGDILQRKFWPNNRFANALRAILKWPCLRT